MGAYRVQGVNQVALSPFSLTKLWCRPHVVFLPTVSSTAPKVLADLETGLATGGTYLMPSMKKHCTSHSTEEETETQRAQVSCQGHGPVRNTRIPTYVCPAPTSMPLPPTPAPCTQGTNWLRLSSYCSFELTLSSPERLQSLM